jgi:hypothetical protein
MNPLCGRNKRMGGGDIPCACALVAAPGGGACRRARGAVAVPHGGAHRARGAVGGGAPRPLNHCIGAAAAMARFNMTVVRGKS